MLVRKTYNGNIHTLLKAEAFCAEAIEGGIPFDQLTIAWLSAFQKCFRPEIEDVISADEEERSGLSIFLNRNGLYDLLPEGLFHQPKGISRTANVQDMVEEYKRNRDDEKAARKFFQPLEQEFFRYGVLLQREELRLSFGMLDGALEEELSIFWEIPHDLPAHLVRALLRLMPWLPYIKGNHAHTARCLGYLLGKKVDILEQQLERQSSPHGGFELGKETLGVTCVTGSCFDEPSLLWTFTVHDVGMKEMEDYRPGGAYGKLLIFFAEVFIPLVADHSFGFTVCQDQQTEAEAVLGYSLCL